MLPIRAVVDLPSKRWNVRTILPTISPDACNDRPIVWRETGLPSMRIPFWTGELTPRFPSLALKTFIFGKIIKSRGEGKIQIVDSPVVG
jgi:hypothetical protein